MIKDFHIIVAGAGPAGLVAAHCLQLAGIDFTVLEQRDDIAFDQGASLVLKPQSLRVMHQVGLLDQLLAIGGEIDRSTAFSSDGQLIGNSNSLSYMKENHGVGAATFHRSQLIQTIYDGLSEEAKARIITGKKIANVTSDEDGVKVFCADGSVYEGSVLIGADGVHSRTRRAMRSLALKNNSEIDWDPDTPYVSTYRCMWCSFPAVTRYGLMSETHDKDRSVMYLTGKTRGWIFCNEKLPQPTQDRVTYTDQDVSDLASRFAKYRISPELTVGDVFANRMTAGMSNLEEGVVQHWSWGRIVLVGDACHKYTPNGGNGFNNGIQDVVALCNGIAAAVGATSTKRPSLAELMILFQKYQDSRLKEAQADYASSSHMTRMHADANLFYFILGHYVLWLTWVRYILMKWMAPRSIRKGLILDYVAAEERLNGAVSWAYAMKKKPQR